MDESFEGLRLDVLGSELKTLADKQAQFHQSRIELLSKAQGTVAATMAEVEEDLVQAKGYSGLRNDPSEELRSRVKAHQRQRDLYQFIGGHLREERLYSLRVNDLSFFGIGV